MQSRSILALLAVVAASAVFTFSGAAANEANMLGPGTGVNVDNPRDNPCPGSALLMNHDGSSENGYAWRSGGVVPPDYGAFAEGYTATGYVCGAQFFFSTLEGYYYGQTLDAFVYASDGTSPASVLAVATGIVIDPPAIWPEVNVQDVDLPDTWVDSQFFVGGWGNWPGMLNGWFFCSDLDGPGGMPRTHIAPGIGYPTGWQDPSLVWGPTEAMGIGAYLMEGPPPVPVEDESWGRIKRLFH